MGILEDIRQMKSQGMDDSMIINAMQERGISYRDILDALSQNKIKAAVEGQYSSPEMSNSELSTSSQTPETMQASMMQTTQNSEGTESFPDYDSNAPVQQPSYDYPAQQQVRDYIPASLSSDTITEISEQIVSEKLSEIRKKMEKIISSKSELDVRTDSIEERLKRIEKIIDTLQASVLRKVGDYVTNVDDIKKELFETQKTLGKILGLKYSEDKK